MVKILFVCHGNICRSPMAEFVMKDLVKNDPIHTTVIDITPLGLMEITRKKVYKSLKEQLS